MKQNSPYGISIKKTELCSHAFPRLSVGVTFEKKRVPHDSFINEVAQAYRDVFGHGAPVDTSSWGEYLHCDRCNTQKSIEEVYKTNTYANIETLEKENFLENIACQCGIPMRHFYPLHDISNEIRNHFLEREALFGAFLLEEPTQRPQGFTYAWSTTIAEVWKEKFAHFYRNTDLSYDDFVEQIKKNSGKKLTESSSILYIAEIGATIPARNQKTIAALAGAFFENIPKKIVDLPTIMTIQEGIHSYVFARAAGCTDVCRTERSKTVVLHGTSTKMRDAYTLPTKEFGRKYGQKIKEILRECRDRTQKKSSVFANLQE